MSGEWTHLGVAVRFFSGHPLYEPRKVPELEITLLISYEKRHFDLRVVLPRRPVILEERLMVAVVGPAALVLRPIGTFIDDFHIPPPVGVFFAPALFVDVDVFLDYVGVVIGFFHWYYTTLIVENQHTSDACAYMGGAVGFQIDELAEADVEEAWWGALDGVDADDAHGAAWDEEGGFVDELDAGDGWFVAFEVPHIPKRLKIPHNHIPIKTASRQHTQPLTHLHHTDIIAVMSATGYFDSLEFVVTDVPRF